MTEVDLGGKLSHSTRFHGPHLPRRAFFGPSLYTHKNHHMHISLLHRFHTARRLPWDPAGPSQRINHRNFTNMSTEPPCRDAPALRMPWSTGSNASVARVMSIAAKLRVKLDELREHPDRVRNICILAHVDHGARCCCSFADVILLNSHS
jgi:hypothetical protein